MNMQRFHALALCLAIVTVAACGDGDGGSALSTTAGPGSNAPWQQGVFQNVNTFFARCAAPRSGTNPATNQPYPDVQGTILDENNFLRSFSNLTYLWYDEIVDQDPALFNSPLAYFDELKTDAITVSGQAKDKFHFTYDSEEWFQLSQSGVSAGYGAQWAILRSTVPREIVVAYTEPNTPATSAQVDLARGARLVTVDGVDVVNANTQQEIDALNAALFPSATGESHAFVVRDLGAATTRTVTMTSALITSDPVQNVKVISTPTGRVGYLLFNDHIATAEDELIDAINTLNSGQGIDDLVLDVRYNGGGFLAIASQLAYMIAGPANTTGRRFERLQFNDKHPNTNPVTGQSPIEDTPFYSQTLGFGSRPEGQPLPTLNLSQVYVLTGAGTCSASESIMNGLDGVNVEVIQIGSTTCGKPYGFYPQDNCGTTYFTIQFRGVNAQNFGDYTDGFSPFNTQTNAGTLMAGCSVADDFENALGDPNEARLKVALDFRNTLNCPAPTGMSTLGSVQQSVLPPQAKDVVVPKSPWHKNRILSR
jgi:C-terminal processing protease CtpA/Prc